MYFDDETVDGRRAKVARNVFLVLSVQVAVALSFAGIAVSNEETFSPIPASSPAVDVGLVVGFSGTLLAISVLKGRRPWNCILVAFLTLVTAIGAARMVVMGFVGSFLFFTSCGTLLLTLLLSAVFFVDASHPPATVLVGTLTTYTLAVVLANVLVNEEGSVVRASSLFVWIGTGLLCVSVVHDVTFTTHDAQDTVEATAEFYAGILIPCTAM